MKLRFWIGAVFIALAAGLFAFRGAIVGYVVEKWEKRGVPEAVRYDEVATVPVTASGTEESPANVGDEDFTVVGRDSSVVALPQNDEIYNPSQPPLTLRGGEIELPAEFNLAVPFTSQAPFAVWDEIHDDACEEAAVIMVDAFFDGRSLSPQLADDEIYQLVDWQTQNLGRWKDTNVEETARILREVYGYQTVRIVENPTLEMIKREIFAGRPVIVPAAGQMLGNPYFRGAGPPYHMLVVRGWTKDGRMIVNDPGTKRGDAFLYAPEVLLNAIHDWTGSDETITQGRKVMIVVEK